MLEHGSIEWHAARRRGIGSSDAPTIMGASPWKNILELYEEKIATETKHTDNWAMARGRELEPVARDLYEIEYGLEMPPKLVKHKRYDYFLANLDGFNDENNFGIEIKCPGKKDRDLALLGQVPGKYFPQLQWQMLVAGSPTWHYVSYAGTDKVTVVQVNADKKYQRELELRARLFWYYVRNRIRPNELYFGLNYG